MTKMGWKQFALSIEGAMVCRIGIMGCYPLVPAFFAAVYLEENGRWLLSVGMIAGMVAFLPISVIAKYGMALLVIGVTVRMSEWVEKKCSTILGAVAASLGTFALSIFGGIFDIRNQISIGAAICRSCFYLWICRLSCPRNPFIFGRKRKTSATGRIAGGIQRTASFELCKEF